ncbi:hypothetical protein L1987_14045 [Smallanthus sonchifolius]|uniref:Uncharacterized protein n=1 Tax=Smallanthus sonchifolius TaxID=185202 RepID=A0ACB9JJ81_9ASTR|nr:hypothetical protein L1987_14045 [Smallanthus sonchifolius]
MMAPGRDSNDNRYFSSGPTGARRFAMSYEEWLGSYLQEERILLKLYGQENNIKLITKDLKPFEDVGPQKCLAFSTGGSKFAARGWYNGRGSSHDLTENLQSLGFESDWFKTGIPARGWRTFYLPLVTSIVVQNRHHTPFFPDRYGDKDTIDRSGDILPVSLLVIMSIFWRRGLSMQHQEKEQPELQSQSKVNELKAALGPLSGRSLLYCTDACLRRYLEARNWNVEKAKKMLEETLAWRSTYKPEEIRWHEVAVEGETGKLFRANFHDRVGRTVLILKPGLQNTTSMDNQIRHLVYLMENAMLNLPEGQEEMAWLIDFTGWSFTTNVPVRTAKDTINILQDHYPQRLAVAFLYSPPRIFQAFWKIVKIFMDPKTVQKVKFVYPKNKESVELMRSYFDVDNLPTEFGGKATMKYDHEDFSRLMAQDDVKAAKFWDFDQKTGSATAGYAAGAAVAPEPVKSASIIAS